MRPSLLLIPSLAAILTGCGSHDDAHGPAGGATADHAAADPHAGHDHGPGGDGIALSANVRKNLGITWATAEYRVVQGVVRMPGRFEAEPSARRPYQSPLPGRIEVLVKPYQTVAAGAVLYRLHAADWLRLQQEIAEAAVAVHAAEDRLIAAQENVSAVDQALELWSGRLATLERLGAEVGGKAAEQAEAAGRVADLRISAAEAKRELADAVRQARPAPGATGTGQAQIRLDLLLGQAAQLTGLTPAALLAADGGAPAWATMTAIEVRALSPGVVEGEVIPSGSWIEGHATVLTVTDPAGVRLRAAGLQADLPRFGDGLPARIVAADPAVQKSVPAHLTIGPVADAIDRSVDIIARPAADASLPAWVRPGVTANLEVVLSGSPEEELAIPVAATIRDGLKTVFFRRDRRDPDVVAKVEADLGASDGRWVVVQSGLKEGDQVVLGGIYPLKLSQQEGGAEAGHFEADGTFHTGKH
ncbi:MAG: hypothetical protein J0M02_05000 [Planctomycetes bacterium]|nr:hypothetical protein [Planctomycetota bacterium]